MVLCVRNCAVQDGVRTTVLRPPSKPRVRNPITLMQLQEEKRLKTTLLQQQQQQVQLMGPSLLTLTLCFTHCVSLYLLIHFVSSSIASGQSSGQSDTY